MKLLLDLGNTRLKWGYSDSANKGRILENTGASVYGDDVVAPLDSLPILKNIDQVWLSSVSGEGLTRVVTDWAERRGIPLVLANACLPDMPIKHCYSEPADLGIDRWLAMLAAHSESNQSVGIIDAGSAITVDVVTADGQHQGGLIMPGLGLLSQALQTGTALQWQGKKKTLALANNTADAINNGVLTSAVASIEKSVALAVKTAEIEQWYITGGDAETLMPHLENALTYRPNLVLEGLARVAARAS